MTIRQGGMTVDRLIAKLATIEQQYIKLQREYARVGAELVAMQEQQPTAITQAPTGTPLAPPDEHYDAARPPTGVAAPAH